MIEKVPTVLFSTYGSHKYGAGHVVRDLDLVNSLGIEVNIYFHVNGSDWVYETISEHGIQDILKGSLKAAVKKTSPDLLLYDRPYSCGKIADIYGIHKPKIIGLDYFYYDDDRVDVAINIKNHYLNRHTSKKIEQIYEGVEYAIIRSEILKHRVEGNRVNGKVVNVLVTFGGADPRNHTKRVLQILNCQTQERFNIKIILGYIFRRGLEYRLDKMDHDCEVKSRVREIGALMNWADVAFCGGGTTMMELLCIGCPTVVIPQNDDEMRLAKSISEEGAILLLGKEDTDCSGREKVEELILDPALRKKMVEKGKNIFDGKGKDRIRQFILKEL